MKWRRFSTPWRGRRNKSNFRYLHATRRKYKWWGMEKRRIGGKVTWEDFRRIFLDRHFPTSIREQKEREFILLEQGQRSVAQYDAAFNRLSNFAPQLVATEIDRAKRFRSGLNPSIKLGLATCKAQTYGEILDEALLLEKSLHELRQSRSDSIKKRPPHFPSHQEQHKKPFRHKKQGPQTHPPSQGPKCHKCGKAHEVRDCPIIKGAYFNCGRIGHRAADCREEKKHPETISILPITPRQGGNLFRRNNKSQKHLGEFMLSFEKMLEAPMK